GDLPEELAKSALSFLLLDVAEGADVASVRSRIESDVPDVDVYTPAEIGENDVRRVEGFLGAPLSLLIAIAWVVAALVVALTLYASVLHRLGELALALAIALSALLGWAAPQYPVEPFDPRLLARALGLQVAVACLAPAFAIRRAVSVDPALVFTQ